MVIVHPMSAVPRSTAGAGVSSSLRRTIVVAAGIWALSAALASIELVAARVSDGPVAVCHAYQLGQFDTVTLFSKLQGARVRLAKAS